MNKKEQVIRLRSKDEKTIQQSKLTDKYVVHYFCTMWNTGGQLNGRKAGYAIYKNGKWIKSLNSLKLKEFEKKNEIEWMKSAKEIRDMI